MLRPTLIIVLISLAGVDSGHNTPNSRPTKINISNVPHGFHLNQNNHISSSSSNNISHFAGGNVPTEAEHIENGRDKRGAQLDQSEIARQNQITQQIFANYLERRLFPNRTANQKIPTIADILPKPKPSPRPRPRGFAAQDGGHFKRSGGGAQRNRLAAAATKRQTGYNRKRVQKVEEEEEDDQEEDRDQQPQANQEDFDYDVQESLQSVESEQHDQYYGNIFHRDPSENEVDADCPNCVDESQYTPNKWTMPLLKLGEKRYYLGIFFKANWFKATQYCRYHGMHLASISSQEENDRLEKHIRDFGLGHEHFWISGTDLADEGNFFWMATGRPITFTNWNAGEPNNFRYENGEEENCLELWNRDGKGLKWNDSPCSFETYFVCEVQPN
ncbi:low affinity immunoglobulin epsilon Fc receptor isoform X1 [Drosophila elegans]|uniref:low affinity immunoglobulin epsilon Fc receptor isoform X1 n=1 Tax=Drosophila elegans TaxID=30023 RepID=UPI0007E89428|nr:low affinity immunoglobulin epsilon Fc receptor isoform X1 [Drosophila elegans]